MLSSTNSAIPFVAISSSKSFGLRGAGLKLILILGLPFELLIPKFNEKRFLEIIVPNETIKKILKILDIFKTTQEDNTICIIISTIGVKN
jgi:hypothetical protein